VHVYYDSGKTVTIDGKTSKELAKGVVIQVNGQGTTDPSPAAFTSKMNWRLRRASIYRPRELERTRC
jgi:hypothetical protein